MSDQTGITQITEGLNGVASTSLLAQCDARGLLEQQIISDLPQFPQLADIQTKTLPFGSTWLDEIQPALLGVVEDIADYADGVKTFNDSFQKILSGGGDPASIQTTIDEGLQELITQAQEQQSNANTALAQIQAFNRNYSSAVGNFDTEAAAVSNDLAGSAGEVAQLQQQIIGFEAQLQSDYKTIASGATETLPGIFMVTVGTLVFIESEGERDELMKAGIQYIEDKESDMTQASEDAQTTLQEYSNALQTLTSEQFALTAITTIKGSIDGLQSAGDSANSGIQSLQDGWDTVVSYLNSIVAIKDPAAQRSEITADFQDNVDRWNALHQAAQNFLSVGTMKVQTV